MSNKDRRLGRGLEALLGQLPGWNNPPAANTPGSPAPQPSEPVAPPPVREPPAPAPAVPPPAAGPASPPPAARHPAPVMPASPPPVAAPVAAAPPAPLPKQVPAPVAAAPSIPAPKPIPEPPPRPASAPAVVPAVVPASAVLAAEHVPEPSAAPEHAGPGGSVRIDIGLIDSNPFQPRQEFSATEIRTLAESLTAHGLLQPIVVRKIGDRFQLIAGERRLRAAVQAGWTDVPAAVVEADDRQTAEMAIVENLQRRDLNPLEKAASFQRYLQEFGCTQEELAGRLMLDRSTIANLIRLLELPEPVQDALRRGRITQGHARALLPLGEERDQVAFCKQIQDEGLNVRQTESLVQQMLAGPPSPALKLIDRDGKSSGGARSPSQHLAALEQQFRSALGVKVSITHNAKGRGKLVVHFNSHEEFERLRQFLCEPSRPAAKSG